MRERALGLFVLVLAVAGCSGETTAAGPLDYDESQPLELTQPAETRDGEIVVRDLSYASGTDRIAAYLVFPAAGDDDLPGVVHLHGSGGDREQMLASAKLLAQQGAVALTLSAPSQQRTQPAGLSAADSIRWQRDETIADVVAARRGLDVLEAYERVDDERLGLLGFSLGGRLATLVAGVDERVRATILISAGAAPVSEYVDAAPAELRDDVREVLPAIDPLSYVGEITGSLFIQIGRTDSVVPQDALENVVDAAPDGTRVVRYQTDHGLDAKAERDRVDWLVDELRLDR
ncbi:MAG: alpha/beta fold hydrolase [Actinobacteria bacterium]|nr:alpha/beta fold hydrolase [Actinomycetota bacterium]